jgi:microcystin-dependent protein
MDYKKLIYPALAAILTAGLFKVLGWIGNAPNLIVPSNAVIAFNLASCPNGWNEYKKAESRMIIGVGHGKNLSPRHLEQQNGKENIILTDDQLPKHRHRNPFPANKHSKKILGLQPTQDLGEYGYFNKHKRGTDYAGKGKPFKSMPPFIALLYCIKN